MLLPLRHRCRFRRGRSIHLWIRIVSASTSNQFFLASGIQRLSGSIIKMTLNSNSNSIRTRSKRSRVDDCSKVPRGRGRPKKEDSINNENNGSPARRPRSTRNRKALSMYSPSSPDVAATVVTDTCKGRKLQRKFWCDACSCKNGICKKPWEIQVPLHLRPGLGQGQGIHNQPATFTPCPFESNIPIDSAISTVQTGSVRASSSPRKRFLSFVPEKS